jgi:hypothetical protein
VGEKAMWTGQGWDWVEFLKYAVGAVLVVASSAIGGYWGAYAKKKGENTATREDIGALVDQVKAVTKATEEIKTEISGGLWDRQKRWEIKREVLFELVRRVSRSYAVLNKLEVGLRTGLASSSANNPFHMKTKIEENGKWFESLRAIEESGLFVDATCDKIVGTALSEYRKLAVEVAVGIFKDDANIFKAKSADLLKLRNNVLAAVRKDLGIDLTPQSSGSSAVPNSAP